MADAHEWHQAVIRRVDMYRNTAHWHPVITDSDQTQNAARWLDDRAPRGTAQLRNEWLHPTASLFLIRELRLATEFKLRWGC